MILATLAFVLAPLTKADPMAPSPEAGAAPAIAAQLADAQKRVSAVLEGVGQNGGKLPDGADVELKTAAGLLLTVAGGSAPAATPTEGADSADKSDTSKALPPAVEASLTVDYIREKFYSVQSMLREGKLEEAKTALAEINGLLDGINVQAAAAPAAAETGKADMTKSVTFNTQDEVAAWALKQAQLAASDPAEVCVKRLTGVATVVKTAKANWEQTGAGDGPKPLTISITSAYAGDKMGAVDSDAPAAEQKASGGGAGTNLPNGSQPAATQFSATQAEFSKVASALVAMLQPTQPAATQFSSNTVTKADKAKPFVWPNDFSKAAKASKVAKSEGGSTWGADPLICRK